MTKSEELFELFCATTAIRADRVQTERKRMPDYTLRLGDLSMIASSSMQVPQNNSLYEEALEEMDESDAFCQGVPGNRVRSKIDSAMPQVKGLSGGLLPTLLVLYDNVQLWPEICDPYAIGVAMHGIETVLVTAEVAPGVEQV